MNFIVKLKKSTTSIFIDLIMNALKYNTHNLYEFNIPKIPVLQSYIILSQKKNLENYAETICILFTSWHTNFDIKSNLTIFCEVTLNNVYQHLLICKRQ